MHNFINEVPANPDTVKGGKIFRTPYGFGARSIPCRQPYHTSEVCVKNDEVIYRDRNNVEIIFEFPDKFGEKKEAIIADLKKYTELYPERKIVLGLCIYSDPVREDYGEHAVLLFTDVEGNLIHPDVIRFHHNTTAWNRQPGIIVTEPDFQEEGIPVYYKPVLLNELSETSPYSVCLDYKKPATVLLLNLNNSERYSLFSETLFSAIYDLYSGSVNAEIVKINDDVYCIGISTFRTIRETQWFKCKIIDYDKHAVSWSHSVYPYTTPTLTKEGVLKGVRKLFSAELAKLRWSAGECEAVQQCLDDLDVPREINGEELSLWGRIVQFKLNSVPYEVSGTSVLKEKKNVD